MDQNPLVELSENVKQQKLNDELSSIKTGIKKLNDKAIPHLIELEIFQEIGSSRIVKKVSINPEYIVCIKEDEPHAFVYLVNEVVLHTVESRSAILELLTPKKYIQ